MIFKFLMPFLMALLVIYYVWLFLSMGGIVPRISNREYKLRRIIIPFYYVIFE
mgnify:FL=1|jgi:hypothetical protein|nr:MAG TPA: hypothetical protein [Caudoviricetes sp.]